MPRSMVVNVNQAQQRRRSSASHPLILFLIGGSLAVHPIACALLLAYRRTTSGYKQLTSDDNDPSSVATDDMSSLLYGLFIDAMDGLAFWVLDIVPQLASIMWAFALVVFLMVMGWTHPSSKPLDEKRS